MHADAASRAELTRSRSVPRARPLAALQDGAWGGPSSRVFFVYCFPSPCAHSRPRSKGITRQQDEGPAIPSEARLRIWLIGVGQGDAILIELPANVSQALGNPEGDPVNILIDGGATPTNLAKRTPVFLHRLYAPQRVTIEHMVLTHHDRDHVIGLTRVLEDEAITVKHVYANGLAAFKRGVRGIPKSGSAGGFIGDTKRSLGRFDDNGELESKYFVKSLGVLKQRVKDGELVSDYGDFAAQIAGKRKPQAVESFEQACLGCPALDAIAAPAAGARPLFKPGLVISRLRQHDLPGVAETTAIVGAGFRDLKCFRAMGVAASN